ITLSDVKSYGRWWLIASSDEVDLCTDDPGKDVDLYVHSDLPDLAEVWMGDVAVREAISSDTLKVTGSTHLSRTITSWFPQSRYSNIRPKRLVEEI
ncbi:MAG: SCP2 sterol-binding domain-containing protein, partial [Altererythrobacter sp.]|nr:SCP2 sterol-binding domain-containing protein [Altererythrobacter sp.]